MQHQNIFEDTSFLERVKRLELVDQVGRSSAQLDSGALTSAVDALEEHLGSFNHARRRAVQMMGLQEAGRDLGEHIKASVKLKVETLGFVPVVESVKKSLSELKPIIDAKLDDILELNKAENHPVRAGLQRFITANQFSDDEASWFLAECESIGFRLLSVMMNGDFANLLAIADASATGEFGIRFCGFPRLTGNASTDERILDVVGRCRQAGITVSLYHLLPIVLTGTIVASYHNQKLPGRNRPKLLAHFGVG